MWNKDQKVLVLKPPVKGRSKNVVRDFVYGCWCNGRRVGGMQMPPLNDLYVVSHARQHGLPVDFLDAQFEPERFAALRDEAFNNIRAVVLLSSTQSFVNDVKVIKDIKSLNPDVASVLFGSHPTFMPQNCMQVPEVDYLVLREPEESCRWLFAALLQGQPVDQVEGIAYRNEASEIVFTPPRDFIDLDKLPIPDRSLLPDGVDYFNPVVKKMPYATIQTSRGCPGKCVFCTAPEFYGKKIRFRSTENVMKELREIVGLGYKEVFFRDETFTAYKKRNVEICEAMIEEDLRLSWIANGRVDMIDKDTMALMKRAGCHMLKFGVESGSDTLLANYRKGTSVAQARKVFRDAREVGLDTHAHNVFGGPGETPESLQKTIDLAIELEATTASFGILTPYPGTLLFAKVAEKRPEIGDGTASNMDNLHVDGFFSEEVCGMSGDDLSKWIVKAYRSFYLRPGYLWKRLIGIRSFDEFMTLFVAGLNIFQFSISGEK